MPAEAPSPVAPTETVTDVSFEAAIRAPREETPAPRLDFAARIVPVTVAVMSPPPSAKLAGLMDRSTIGPSSSASSICGLFFTSRPLAEPTTVIFSGPSWSESSVGVSVKVATPVLWPGQIERSKLVTAV